MHAKHHVIDREGGYVKVGFRLDVAKKRANLYCKLQGLIFANAVNYNINWSSFSWRLDESATFYAKMRSRLDAAKKRPTL